MLIYAILSGGTRRSEASLLHLAGIRITFASSTANTAQPAAIYVVAARKDKRMTATDRCVDCGVHFGDGGGSFYSDGRCWQCHRFYGDTPDPDWLAENTYSDGEGRL
jgi:hypothetical protein